ncbi:MAG TPA: ABC transporter permease [Candidatus Eisenbacteria bacterium]|nr:ABC transporter permease [Candidatus Eisenbacteria bacterium]
MIIGGPARSFLRVATALTLLFIYVPIALVFVYALNESASTVWPPVAFSFKWIFEAIENTALIEAFLTSLTVAFGATVIALVLGTLASMAVSRYRFFGREAISFVVIFPIALPGIVTGIALATSFAQLDFPLGILSIVVGHATFCIVIVYNNALARLRRTAGSFEEASADLGAQTWQTFRYVTFPALRSALFAGGLLAFALSFDEVIVTIFTNGGVKTLPIWIFESYQNANQVPLVSVAGAIAIVLSVIPVYLAMRITGDASGVTGARG